MATDPVQNRANPERSQDRSFPPSPGNVVLLHDLTEIHALWGVSHRAVYRAVERGSLRAYGRPGRQKYYSEAELVQVFGEPPHRTPPPDSKRLGKSASVSGR